ncbi:hypothetical protein KCU77_g3323, partial [Aureobasidium melanogenum]
MPVNEQRWNMPLTCGSLYQSPKTDPPYDNMRRKEIITAQEVQAEQEHKKALKQARIDYKKLGNAAAIAAKAMRAKDFKSCIFEWQLGCCIVCNHETRTVHIL